MRVFQNKIPKFGLRGRIFLALLVHYTASASFGEFILQLIIFFFFHNYSRSFLFIYRIGFYGLTKWLFIAFYSLKSRAYLFSNPSLSLVSFRWQIISDSFLNSSLFYFVNQGVCSLDNIALTFSQPLLLRLRYFFFCLFA